MTRMTVQAAMELHDRLMHGYKKNDGDVAVQDAIIEHMNELSTITDNAAHARTTEVDVPTELIDYSEAYCK